MAITAPPTQNDGQDNDTPSPVEFTVIIPTRNRPDCVKRALGSVLAQSDANYEIIVVNDGSAPQHELGYRALSDEFGEKARFFGLRRTERGFGQSYARNFGAAHARCAYLCFLDDDDEWTDPEYLARTARLLRDSHDVVDLLFSDQAAYLNGQRLDRSVWIEDLKDIVKDIARPDASGAFSVTCEHLLQCQGFCHLNTTIFRTAFFRELGGFDVNIRYEDDRDIYLRAIDRANVIKYMPRIVARHNIALNSSTTSTMPPLEKYLFQLKVLDHAILFSSKRLIRRHGKVHKAYTLKKIAEHLALSDGHENAMRYALEVLCIGFSFKWLLVTSWIWLKLRAPRLAELIKPGDHRLRSQLHD